ncbi:MAG TPA: MBL fold metallo-hydrolase [Puia sp.]|nr:MBL fold metallo-hydrolase [Puia sp.]
MKQISSRVYQISLGVVNAFVVEDEGLTLIDTGVKGSADKIFAALKKGGKDPGDIRRIILTHAHPDHSGSVAELKRRLNVPVWAHAEDAKLIEQGIAGRQPMELSPGIINWLVYHLVIKRAANSIEAVRVDRQLADNELLPIAGGIQVLHTPGHSAGHLSLLVKNEGVLIAADICANGGGLGLSILYEDTVLGVKSILKAASFDFDIALFGHGGPLVGEANRKMKNKFYRI